MSSVSSMRAAAEVGEVRPERVGPYAICGEIGSGGMASVHLGQLRSTSGFTRTVAIKRMHAELARSPEFVAMFFQEARLVGRIQHPNVVAALDCVAIDNDAMLVMEYIHGVSLNHLMRQPVQMPLAIASAILVGAALGLHAAHEAVDENGNNLRIVHRDISPQNILVGVDGIARVLDFGIAKAAKCVQHTRTGEVRGKVSYMAPEQLLGNRVDREADVYSLGVIMWELLTGQRLFPGKGPGQMLMRMANGPVSSPRRINPKLTPHVEAIVLKALARTPETRYRSALQFAEALESTIRPASQRVVGEWIASVGRDELAHRAAVRSRIERMDSRSPRSPEDDVSTPPLPLSEDGAAGSVSFVRIGTSRRRNRLARVVAGAAVLVATLGATMAVRWAAAAARPGRLAKSFDRSPMTTEARTSPSAGTGWTVPTAWTATVPSSSALPGVLVVAAPATEISSRRTPSRVQPRPHAAPAPKSNTSHSAPAPAPSAGTNASASAQSEFSLIGGRE
jgi:eukaryotic-like serine/threonine-protein kinase